MKEFKLLDVILGIGVMVGSYYAKSINENLANLNIKVATIIEKTNSHDKQLEKLNNKVFH